MEIEENIMRKSFNIIVSKPGITIGDKNIAHLTLNSRRIILGTSMAFGVRKGNSRGIALES